MPATREMDEIVSAQLAAFTALIDLGRSLTEEEWDTPSELPGWSVKDNYSHLVGAEGGLFLGWPAPDIEVPDAPHLRNPIAKVNEAWVLHYRNHSGAEVLADFEQAVADRSVALTNMTEEEFRSRRFTPAGEDEHGRFLQVRIFDCWMHEQDCRGPLGKPGHDAGPVVEVSIDEFTNAAGFIIGKKAGATEGQSVRLHLTGSANRTIDVLVDGRAKVVDHVDSPTTTISIPTVLWMRYIGGRRQPDPADPSIVIGGDTDLAQRVITSASYTI